jgi:voltage-gated potassium channel
MEAKYFIRHLFDEHYNEGSKAGKFYKPVRYFIIFLIFISAVQIFIDSDQSLADTYNGVLYIVDFIITIVFTIELFLRVWVCRDFDKRFSGKYGRAKYLLSPNGLVDLLAVLPFYIFLITPLGIAFLQVSRVFRILKVFKYMTSFRLIANAVKIKKSELLISMQVVIILTFFLAVILYIVEHRAQSGAFQNIWSSIKWAVGKYINGIGGYGDYIPVTAAGKFLATLVGFMGIAIVAVPAGIIASGFVEEMQKMKKGKDIKERISKLEKAFTPAMKSKIGIAVEPKYRGLPTMQTRLLITQDEIIEAARNSENLRLKWTKSDMSIQKFDMLIIEHFPKNTEYGYRKLNKNSNIFIINPIGRGEQGFSHFTRCIAESMDSNYLSNEVFSSGDVLDNHRCGFDTNSAYNDTIKQVPSAFKQFKKDVVQNIKQDDWVFIFKSSASSLANNFHFLFGGQAGETGFDFPNITLNDPSSFSGFYTVVKNDIEQNLKYSVGTHEHFGATDKNQLHQYVRNTTGANVVTVFISINIIAYNDENYFELIKLFKEKITTFLVKTE